MGQVCTLLSVFIIKVDDNWPLTAVFVRFRLNSKLREQERELFKMRDDIQLLQVNLHRRATL